ncbi:MAG TPA: tRNA (adenosine(37)-N6)-threonylcarbamoyltransferase complex ATPase subunit type 1 TsaE [Cyclobacteriaceae bacterium]|nr:tRNA (adenosine(37)-N6)-threonylcarbamoyltransferase complex ATPase subunit type 1 TsaE [Cyclobacteriaceae bacterium]
MYPEVKRQAFEKVKQAELERVGGELMQAAGNLSVFVFHGDMGSGKTTFVKAICKFLGVEETMSSPTFSIVNEYQTKGGDTIFHFDFYRIKNEAEAYDIGVEEYFDSGHYCFVEWPEKIPTLLPTRYAEVFMKIDDNAHRTIAFSIHDGEKKDRV